jgi:hypothetical protein
MGAFKTWEAAFTHFTTAGENTQIPRRNRRRRCPSPSPPIRSVPKLLAA